MDCHPGHLYDVDETSFPMFLGLSNPSSLTPFATNVCPKGSRPRAVTHGPVPKPPGYKKYVSPPPLTPYPIPVLCPEWSFNEWMFHSGNVRRHLFLIFLHESNDGYLPPLPDTPQ